MDIFVVHNHLDGHMNIILKLIWEPQIDSTISDAWHYYVIIGFVSLCLCSPTLDKQSLELHCYLIDMY